MRKKYQLLAVIAFLLVGFQLSAQTFPDSEIEQLQKDCKSCLEGLTLLKSNMYAYPTQPSASANGKKPWNDVFSEFKSNNLASCKAIGAYINKNKGKKVVAPVEKSYKEFNVSKWEEYFESSVGIETHGSRITTYCPKLHKSQFDCVEASRRMMEISIPGVEKIISILGSLECTPENGYAYCRVAGKANIHIFGTEKVSPSAMVNVDHVYTTMTDLFKPAYPVSKFNGYKIYLTNQETIKELDALVPINQMWKTGTGEGTRDELRGGTTMNYLWISEQLICKTGVATRGTKDKSARTYDQVVHEFAHAIDFRFGLRPIYDAFYTEEENKNFPNVERWPWAVQHWFGTPSGKISEKELGLLNKLFKKRASFPCSSYEPNVVKSNFGNVTQLTQAKNILNTGETLKVGERLTSSNGVYYLIMQNDGNLCVYKTEGNKFVWCSMAHGFAGGKLTMQNDGNLVVHDKNNAFKWGSYQVKKYPLTAGCKLILQDDGKLIILNSSGQVVWSNK